ncbi:amino acid adenylation domain-containing protein [Micromonospora sp. KLBMP9576]|uniref:amino acid adenylation domain-containing protein n=1 Tax=Micromonospora sp. KLBMP9576 TaxID=3424769 RepID=UPI003D8DD684
MSDLQSRIAALSPEQRARLESRVAGLTDGRPARADGIPPRDRSRPTPLSYAQQREWAVEQFRPSNNVTAALRLDGRVDLDLLSRVLTAVTERHEALRSTVEIVDRQPVQVVQPVEPLPIAVVDLGHLDAEGREAAIREHCDAEVTRTFPANQVHRLRATALRLEQDAYVMVVTLDHAAADAWSMAILLREVTALYPALRGGLPADLPPLPIQYGDFAVWERDWLDERRMAEELAHWRRTLADIPPRLALPTDRSPAVRRTFAGDHHTHVMGREQTEALQRFAEREGVSLSMVMLAACSVLLHRYTHQDDLVFGSAVGGRLRPETEQLIGCFANALPLRMRLAGIRTLREALTQAREVVSTAFDHQGVPFDRLIEELAPAEAAQTPLIQMLINVLSTPGAMLHPDRALELPELRIGHVPMDPGPITIDLILVVQAAPDALHFDWHYSTELFDRGTVERLAAQVPHVLAQFVADPDRRIGDVRLLGATPARPPAVRGAATATGVVELFERQAARFPDAPAVVRDRVAMSYDQLNREANRLAHHLRGLGVGPETPVGVLVERSPALAVAVLGVLKAGGAFLPIDPAYPADRIAYLLDDAEAPVLVATGAPDTLTGVTDGRKTVLLDGPDRLDGGPEHDPADAPRPDSAAYVIYTSGSTGRPKGVVIQHDSLVTFAREVAEHLQLGAGDRFLQFASPGFDVIIEELFPIWYAGGAVVLPPERMAGAALDLVALTEQDRISVMELPAAYWHEWVRELDRGVGVGRLGSLRLVIVGAERVLPERLATWQKFGVPLMHVYGITETTVSSTFFRLPANAPEADLRHLPIGTALPSAELHILDPELRPVPAGGVGELYIGGISVGRGYLRRPGLTAERFVASPDPDRPGERVYRTGDLVRVRADGNLEFLSRVDTQIKIRGYRVEPAEIESAICRHPQIAQAVVTVHEPAPDDRRLVAHVVTRDGDAPNITDLRRFLARELPPYLVPAAFVPVAEIPLTANGKIDVTRLPQPGGERPNLAEELVEPQSPLQRRLAEIVAAVLGVDSVGVNDDFFELGGDSILAIMAVSRAQEEGIGLSPLDIFEHRTIAALAGTVTVAEQPRVIGRRGTDAAPVLSFDQERLWLEDQFVHGPAYNVGWQQRLRGPLDLGLVERCVRTILARHESLRSRFPTVDGRPIQVVDEIDEEWRLRVEDLSAVDDREAVARRLTGDEVSWTFDLAAGPLIRCLVVRLGETDHLISMISHHIVADVVSVGLFVRELGMLYQAGGDLAASGLPELPVQYLDYAVWQRERLAGEELDRQVDYWRDHLAGAPRALTMPTIQHTPAEQARGARVTDRLSAKDTAALHELCRTRDVTPFMVVLSTLTTVLGRWAGQRDVVVGVSFSSRTESGTESLIGSFINTLPMRVDLSGEPTFAELLRRVRDVALGGYAHADAPLDVIMKRLKVTRDPRRTPLFQVMLNVVDVPPIRRFGDIVVDEVEAPSLPPSFDLVLTTNEVEGELTYTLEYDATRFPADLMRALAGHFGGFLAAAVADPRRGLLDYVLDGAVSTAPAAPAPDAAPQRALAWRAAHADAVAVSDGSGSWTYRRLAGPAERITELLAGRPAGPVAVVRRPSAGFVAAVLGVRGAGRPLTVIEPGSDPGAAATVLDPEQADVRELVARPSGVTAAPPQRPGTDWAVERFGFGPADRFAVLSALPGHTMAALSAALHAGGRLVLADRSQTADVEAIAAWLRIERVSVLHAGPPLLRAIAARGELPAIRHVFVENTGSLTGHDVAAIRAISPGCQVVATYRTMPDGRPATACLLPPHWRPETAPLRVPLGVELPGRPVVLRHPGGQPAAVGEVAEICHDGDRTGDLGRRWPDGTLEFVGKASDRSRENRG